MTEAFSSKPFYDRGLPASMRFKHEGAERGAPFDPALHLLRLTNMIEQANAAEDDGDYSDMLRAERDALLDLHPNLRHELPNK